MPQCRLLTTPLLLGNAASLGNGGSGNVSAQFDEALLVAQKLGAGHGDASPGSRQSELHKCRDRGRVPSRKDDRTQGSVDRIAHRPQVTQRVHVRAVDHLRRQTHRFMQRRTSWWLGVLTPCKYVEGVTVRFYP